MIHEVVTELARAAAQTAGPHVRRRAHQQPRAVQRRRAQEHELRGVIRGLVGDGVEHAHARRALLALVVQHLGRDRVHLEREPPRGHRRRQRRGLRAEVAAVRAAEHARVAVLARRAARQRLRRVRDTAGDDPAPTVELAAEAARDQIFAAVQRHGGLKLPVRQLREPVARAGDAGMPLDVVVPRRELRVANGPIDRDAVAHVAFEIEIAPAITLPSPQQGAAADVIAAIPVETLDLGVRRLLLVGPPVRLSLGQRIVALQDRIRLFQRVRAAAAMRVLPRSLASR